MYWINSDLREGIVRDRDHELIKMAISELKYSTKLDKLYEFANNAEC
jgi:hypothetical protein